MALIFFRISGLTNEYVSCLTSGVIGCSFEDITKRFSDYTVLPYKEGISLVEIRMKKSTLTCVLKNNTCIEVYEFSD